MGTQSALVLGAAALGYVCWGECPETLGLAPALAGLWAVSHSRTSAGLTVFAYYLSLSRALPASTSVFFGSQSPSIVCMVLWMAVSATLALPWAFFWFKGPRPRYEWRLLLILITLSVPPLGIFGWGNPLTGAGILFPSTGFVGLITTWLLMTACSYAITSPYPVRNTKCIAIFFVTMTLGTAMIAGRQPLPETSVKGIDTQLSGVGMGDYDFMMVYHNNKRLIEIVGRNAEEKAILLPESVAGLWHRATADLWVSAERKPAVVFLGAADPRRGGNYSNVLVAVTRQESQIVYRQRMPVPVGMWHPWREESAVSYWGGSGVFDLGTTRYGALVCFEQLLIWPVLQTYAASPDIVLAPTNAWWSKDTSVPAIQKSVVTAWARLFGIPVITAYNY